MALIVNKDAEGRSNREKWFEELYHENIEKLLRYTYSITGNKSFSEDIVSEVFVLFWNKREELLHVKDIQAYLARSVRNLSLRKISQHHKEQSFDPATETKHRHELDPENILIGKELEIVIKDVVDHLTPHGRLVYDMARNKGYSHEKIAKELGISKLTVRKHLANVLKAFKIALERHYAHSGDDQFHISKLISLILAFITVPF